jgi:hypothetical protein
MRAGPFSASLRRFTLDYYWRRAIGPFAGYELPPVLKYIVLLKFDFLLLGVMGAASGRSWLMDRLERFGPAMSPACLLVALALIATAPAIRLE